MLRMNPQNPDCPNCNKAGLAILPARYTVVPKDVDATIPASLQDDIEGAELNSYKYALRTLRQGYVYLFYERHSRGGHIKWEVYSVAESGTLWKQLSNDSIRSISADPTCSRTGHRIPASIIAIERPEKCGRVWLAFSDHCWSPETFRELGSDQTLRDRRMQVFSPSEWVAKSQHLHSVCATEANLNEIIEYKSGFAIGTLAGSPALSTIPTISKPDGTFIKAVLRRQASRYPMHIRRHDKKEIIDQLIAVGKADGGKSYTPLIFALSDHMGIAHELNGFRNDGAGWIAKYVQERELEIDASAAIPGVKRAIEQRADQIARLAAHAGAFKWDADSTQDRLNNFKRLNPNNRMGYARQVELCRYWENDATNKVPARIAQYREQATGAHEPEWRRQMANVDRMAEQFWRKEGPDGRTINQRAEQRGQHSARQAVAEAWPKYAARIDARLLHNFEANYAAFTNVAECLIDDRTKDLVTWLESKPFINSLVEYNSHSGQDGVVFEDRIGTALMGIGSTKSGQQKMDEWIAEMKASEKNLLWRVFALNQHESSQTMNEMLNKVNGTRIPLSIGGWEAAVSEIKWHKIADLAKKSLTFHNTNSKALNDAASKITPVKSTSGLEKILLSTWSRFFKPFAEATDSVNVKILQGALLVRAGADVTNALAAVAGDIASQKSISNTTIIDSWRRVGIPMSDAAKNDFKEKSDLWRNLASDADVPDPKKKTFNAATDSRLALVVALLEGYNLFKLLDKLGSNSEDAALESQVQAAMLATSAAVLDLAGCFVKGVHTLKDNAIGFQALKLVGGSLSASASVMGGWADLGKAKKNSHAWKYTVAALYAVRGLSQLASAGLTVLISLSYCSPTLALLGERLALSRTGSVLTATAGRLLAARAILMLVSLHVSVFVLAVSILIWYFEESALEDWCDRCAFGKARKLDRLAFKRADEQSLELKNALMDVLQIEGAK